MPDVLDLLGKHFTDVTGLKAKAKGDLTEKTFYNATDGNNIEYGLTDGTLPLIGVAKIGSAELES